MNLKLKLEVKEVAQQMQELVENIEDKPFKTAMWIIIRANELWEQQSQIVKKQLMEEFRSLS